MVRDLVWCPTAVTNGGVTNAASSTRMEIIAGRNTLDGEE